jgi:Copper binding proteins, plastocyanin/azurin family
MSRIHFAIAAAVAAVLIVVAPAGATLPKLVGTDGPGFTITLKKAGKKVMRLKHGRYTITVKDLSTTHNFHLTGPGLNKKTAVSFQGTKTWTVTLKKGTYKYVCDPHAPIMHGSFKVF